MSETVSVPSSSTPTPAPVSSSDTTTAPTPSSSSSSSSPTCQKRMEPTHGYKVVQIERRGPLSPEEFEEKYLRPAIPVIMPMEDSPAKNWTVESLREKVGENIVHVRRKTSKHHYKVGVNYNIEQMQMKEYIDNMVENNAKGRDSYLAVQNLRQAFPQLLDEAPLPSIIRKLHGGPFLWLAHQNHYEFCHVDPDDGLLMIISGKKHLRLFGTPDFFKLSPNPLGAKGKTVQSQVDLDNPDYERFPDLAHATCYECTLTSGEALYIPSFWWHQVTSIEQTLSLNIFFGDVGENNYIEKLLTGPQYPAFSYWLLNILEQNRTMSSTFEYVMSRLPETLRSFFLKQFHEIPTEGQKAILIQMALDHFKMAELPKSTHPRGKHAPMLRIRGLLWRD